MVLPSYGCGPWPAAGGERAAIRRRTSPAAASGSRWANLGKVASSCIVLVGGKGS